MLIWKIWKPHQSKLTEKNEKKMVVFSKYEFKNVIYLIGSSNMIKDYDQKIKNIELN